MAFVSSNDSDYIYHLRQYCTTLFLFFSFPFLSSIFFSPFQWKVQANVVASKPKHHPLNPKVTAFVATMFVLVEHMGDYFLSLIFLLLVVHASSFICCDLLWQRLIVLNGNSLTWQSRKKISSTECIDSLETGAYTTLCNHILETLYIQIYTFIASHDFISLH